MRILAHPQTLRQFEQYSKLPVQALAVSGEPGAGKGFMAWQLAARILGTTPEQVISHPYIMRLDAAADKIGIDEVRTIQSFLSLTVPGKDRFKRVVILENIDLFGHEAQNALLKTLEEPPKDTVLLVTYSNRSKVLQTIHSRMQVLRVMPVGYEEVKEHFSDRKDAALLQRSHYISGGLSGLLSALVNDSSDYVLLQAIEQARHIVGSTRYQRLSMVEKIFKSKQTDPALLLDAMYRLVEASYRQSLKSRSAKELKPIIERLKLIEKAMNDLHEKVQAKLVFSRLFSEL